jgi:hypothetical protein
MSFAAMTHLPEGLCLNALLTLIVEDYRIFFVGTQIPTVSMMELQFILSFKILINIKRRDVVVRNKVF